MGKRWTADEEKYLRKCMETKLDDGRPVTVELITVLFNNHYNRVQPDKEDRTFNANKSKLKQMGVRKRVTKVDLKKEVEKMKKEYAKPKLHANSRMKWSPKDDMYLVRNWSSDSEEREAVAKHPELNELILIQNALRNGLGDLKTILDIKEKYGLDIVRDLNMLNQVIHDLQELDSRGGTRVG